MRKLVFLIIFSAFTFLLNAQTHSDSKEFKRNRISVVIAHATLPSAIKIDGERAILIVPTWQY